MAGGGTGSESCPMARLSHTRCWTFKICYQKVSYRKQNRPIHFNWTSFRHDEQL